MSTSKRLRPWSHRYWKGTVHDVTPNSTWIRFHLKYEGRGSVHDVTPRRYWWEWSALTFGILPVTA